VRSPFRKIKWRLKLIKLLRRSKKDLFVTSVKWSLLIRRLLRGTIKPSILVSWSYTWGMRRLMGGIYVLLVARPIHIVENWKIIWQKSIFQIFKLKIKRPSNLFLQRESLATLRRRGKLKRKQGKNVDSKISIDLLAKYSNWCFNIRHFRFPLSVLFKWRIWLRHYKIA